MRYRSFSNYLKEKYGQRVYKIPVNLPLTCPNRDGNISSGGCTFCAEVGAAFENLPSTMPIAQQISTNIEFLGKKYKADKYVIYFQNFTNTYLPFEEFCLMIEQAVHENVCAIYISTRPDCVRDEYLEFLKIFSEKHGYDICIELGLQTVNYKTLIKINRGHTLAEFIDAVLRINRFGFEVCAHVILNLPWDDIVDVEECAKFLSSLRVGQVKLHSLYIAKNTPLAELYENNEFQMGEYTDYVRRAITFIEHISPDMVIQRLIGRAKEEHTVFCNYGMSWWKIKDTIDSELERLDTFQGAKCDYLNGKALKIFD